MRRFGRTVLAIGTLALLGACEGKLSSKKNPRDTASGAVDTSRDAVAGETSGEGGDAIDGGDADNPWADRDGDGRLDDFDNCPATPNRQQKDGDGDGVGTACDNCPNIANRKQADDDGDGTGNLCEGTVAPNKDGDGDGVLTKNDNCPSEANSSQRDRDADGVGDACDNCPSIANSGQKNSDGKPAGDACQNAKVLKDGDGDGVRDVVDNCPMKMNPGQTDTDGDTVGDTCDNCRKVANVGQKDGDGDGQGNACTNYYNSNRDTDGDGRADINDNCPTDKNKSQADGDGDSIGDACDNCKSTPNYQQVDSNNDQTGDACTQNPVGKICSRKSANFEQLEPNIYFVIDRSSSMTNKDGTGTNRMTRAKNGLDKVAQQLASKIRVGMSTYPCASNQSCGTFLNHQFLKLGLHSQSKIIDSYRSNFTDSTCAYSDAIGLSGLDIEVGGKHCTETGEAIKDVRVNKLYETPKSDPLNSKRPKRAVLVTDGGACGCGGQSATVNQIRKLRKQDGVKTFVVGFNYSSSNLNDAAKAGGTDAGKPGKPYFYNATNASQLVNTIQNIVGKTISCTYKLNRKKSKIDPNKIWVKVHGSTISKKDFTYDANTNTISLSNSACKTLRNNTSKTPLEIVLGCPSTCKKSKEVCDYKDNDCDQKTDEGCNCTPETCGNQMDEDCDGKIDEGCPPDRCAKQPEICDQKDNDCDQKTDEGCPSGMCTPKREVCDQKNNDCDGQTDEGCPDCKSIGESCKSDGDCCRGSCKKGTCQEPCRPAGVNCLNDSQCCSGVCSASGDSVGTCAGR